VAHIDLKDVLDSEGIVRVFSIQTAAKILKKVGDSSDIEYRVIDLAKKIAHFIEWGN
jgi:hypothetical protein